MTKKDAIDFHRISKAMKFISQKIPHQPSIKEIAQHVGMSEFHFQRIFKKWAGITPKKFMQFLVIKSLKDEVQKSKSVLDLSEKTGFSSQSRVYDLFVNIEAVTPQEYKSKGQGIKIIYGIHETPFGNCFIASTERGICGLEFFEESADEIIRSFKEKWKNANIQKDLLATQKIIKDIFSGNKKPVSVLCLGTKFQIKVWEALLKIPFGKVVSYHEVAKNIGNPKANRAVASAIAKNNIAYIIPCHRVIQSIGKIGGYKWGKERKLSMIGWEKAQNITTEE